MKDLSNNITSTSSSNQTIASSASSLASTPSKTLPATITSSEHSNQMNGFNSNVSSSASPVYDDDGTVEYMDIDNDTSEEPTSSQTFDLSDVPQLVKRPLRRGDHWYILDSSWFSACLSYIEDCSKDRPGRIDNSSLLVPVKNNAQKNYTEPMFRLKPNLTENEDFVVVPEEVWNILVENFRIVNGIGGNPIRCPILEKKGKNSYLIVEIYPLELRLALYGSKEDMVAQYSRNCTLQKIVTDMRSLFRISEDRAVQLWNNATLLVAHSDNISSTSTSSSSSILSSSNIPTNSAAIPLPPPPPPSPSNSSFGQKPLTTSTLEQQLGDLELPPNTTLTIEMQNSDGTWPSSRTKLGAITRSKVASGVPITDPGVCGLMNLGNTCFMNSALQCLSNTPPLTNFLISDRYLEDVNVDNPLGMGGEIVRRYAELIKAIWSGHHVSLSPRDFKIAVSRFAPQFSGFAQHDCQELMAFLLDGLHEDLNRVKKKPYIEAKDGIERRPDVEVAIESWSNYKRRNDSIIVDTFHSQLKSTLVCPECDLVSVTFDPNCYLTLPLPYKRERSVDIVFVPAISKRPNYIASKSRVFPSTVTSSSMVDGSLSSTAQTHLVPARSILVENVMIPKTGCAMEISAAVAKVLNEAMGTNGAPVLNRQLDSTKLRVANVYMNRLNKLFSPDELYNAHIDDLVVYEEDDSPVSTSAEGACQTRSGSAKPKSHILPAFIRESNPTSGEYLISRPFFINIKNTKYEDIREAIFQELLTLVQPDEADAFIQAMNEESVKEEDKPKYVLYDDTSKNKTSKRQNAASLQDGSDGEASEVDEEEEANKPMEENSMVADEEEEEEDEGVEASASGYSTRSRDQPPMPPFTISVVNMYATSDFSVLAPGSLLEGDVNTYLSVNINTKLVSKFFPHDLNTYRQVKLISMMSPSSTRASVPKTSITLHECINQFTTTEKLGSDDPWYCPRCKKHQMADKKFDIWSLPKILIIHLKRFQYSRLHRDKLDVMVEFPTKDLDMTPYVLHNPSNESYVYNLIGVANHYGGLGGGHYTAFAKNAINQNWYHFDDSSVSAVSENAVVTKSAYVLYYQLQKDDDVIESNGSETAVPTDAAVGVL